MPDHARLRPGPRTDQDKQGIGRSGTRNLAKIPKTHFIRAEISRMGTNSGSGGPSGVAHPEPDPMVPQHRPDSKSILRSPVASRPSGPAIPSSPIRPRREPDPPVRVVEHDAERLEELDADVSQR